MELLAKLENLLNGLLIGLGNLLLKLFWKMVPPKFAGIYNQLMVKSHHLVPWLKQLPSTLLKKILALIPALKNQIMALDAREVLRSTYNSAIAKYQSAETGKKISKAKIFFMTPFLMVGEWLQGLSTAQSMMLLGFTAASFLAVVEIVGSSQRLMNAGQDQSRTPASVEVVDEYDRPTYYKKHIRHLDFTGLRIPVYFPQVNELRSVDVDFTVTLKTREAHLLLSKKEFQLRDHLILNVEPSVASFPLEEEGKQILKEKLTEEIHVYMQENKIPGEVEELKITYILAN